MNQPQFQLDENVDVRIAPFLEQKGYSVALAQSGLKDKAVAELAKKEERILLTLDRDFANTDVFDPKEYFGIVIFMIHPPRLLNLESALGGLLETISPAEFKGKLFLLSEKEVEVTEE